MSGDPKIELPPSLQPGDPAPDFTLAAIHKDGTLSLADYRGRSPLLLALFRGLYCPFCRRGIAKLGMTTEKLERLGVETLAVVATEVERARLYFRYRPTRLPLAADPGLSLFRAFRVPKPEVSPGMAESVQTVMLDTAGILDATAGLPRRMSLGEVANTLDKQDAYQWTATDDEESQRQFPQLVGQFLLDRTGIIRWVNIEGAEGLDTMGKFPTEDEFLAAAAIVTR
jgi:peroxiredoxin